MIKAMGHLSFVLEPALVSLEGAEILPSQFLQQDLKSVVSVHSCSEKQRRNESFLSDV